MLPLLGNVDEGYALLKDMSPTIPLEYILKAVALTLVGQEHNSVSSSPIKSLLQFLSLSTSSWHSNTFSWWGAPPVNAVGFTFKNIYFLHQLFLRHYTRPSVYDILLVPKRRV